MCLQHTPWCLLKLSYSSPLAPTHVLWPLCHVNADRRCIVFFNEKTDGYKIILSSKLGSLRVGVVFVFVLVVCERPSDFPQCGPQSSSNKILVWFAFLWCFCCWVCFPFRCYYCCCCCRCMSECLVISQPFPQCVQESSSIWVSPTSQNRSSNQPGSTSPHCENAGHTLVNVDLSLHWAVDINISSKSMCNFDFQTFPNE